MLDMDNNKEIFLILHNIRSVYNVGAIFRTADACGVSKIFLTGYTPSPTDRFGRARKDISKSALGAEKNIPWEHLPKVSELLRELKEQKIQIVAVEQSKDSIDYKKLKINKSTAFIFGNEVDGVDKSILGDVDKIIEISMLGKKESLNVSVCAGIVLYSLIAD